MHSVHAGARATLLRWRLQPLASQAGLKVLMAATGALLTGWVLLHMLGNLLVFAGAEVLNGYGAHLQGQPELLWLMRSTLLLALGVHVGSAWVLSRRARAARPVAYRRRLVARRSTFASRTMGLGGLTILAFLAYHVAHSYGAWHPAYRPGDVYHNVTSGLRDPLVGGLYVLATLVFGLHLQHGLVSALRTLGVAGRFQPELRLALRGLVVALTIGFLLPVLASVAGLL